MSRPLNFGPEIPLTSFSTVPDSPPTAKEFEISHRLQQDHSDLILKFSEVKIDVEGDLERTRNKLEQSESLINELQNELGNRILRIDELERTMRLNRDREVLVEDMRDEFSKLEKKLKTTQIELTTQKEKNEAERVDRHNFIISFDQERQILEDTISSLRASISHFQEKELEILRELQTKNESIEELKGERDDFSSMVVEMEGKIYELDSERLQLSQNMHSEHE